MSATKRILRLWPAFFAAMSLSALTACSLFSQTPDAQTRGSVRSAVQYGQTADDAESKLSGLGYGCLKRSGDYLDENGDTHNADHFLLCEQRPGRFSFTCENRNQVTVVLREARVSGIEVLRGPSCARP